MRGVVASVIALMGGVIFADDAVSPAFTFDARYKSSDITPDAWVSYEAEGLSSRFSATTVTRAADANGNGIPDAWETLYGLLGDDATAGADPDGDGKTNLEEYNAGTNPVLAENHLASISESSSYTLDTWYESTAGDFGTLTEVWALSALFMTDTAGRKPDRDKDGMPDWWENLYGLNPDVSDAHLDSDGDGRTNLQEYNAGTNPVLADNWMLSNAESDEPFTTDTRVWYTGGNPTFDAAFAVIRVSNGFICDTGGLYYDWDGDGIPNWWEARFSRDGTKTGLAASGDDDGDGMTNYGEFVAYTDPTNSASRFVIGLEQIVVSPVRATKGAPRLMATASDMAFALRWQSVKGRTYSVYVSHDLAEGWKPEPVAEMEGTGEMIDYVPPQSRPAMFFRVSVRLSDGY